MIRLAVMIASMQGGGSEQQVLLLLRHLDRRRFAPQLWLQEKTGSLLDQVPADVSIDCFAPPPTRLYWPGRQLGRQVNSVAKLLDKRAPDAIYDRTFGMTMIAAAAADRVGVPRISTIVSPPDRALPLLQQRFVGQKRRRLATAYQRSAGIIAVSNQAADSASKYYGLPRNRFTVIRNPVDIERLQLDVSASRPRRGIIVVGRMTAEKGHAIILDAYARLPTEMRMKCPLQLIGDGPLRESLECKVHELRLTKYVTFAGHLDSTANAIASAEMLVLPSLFEGLPNVVLEAMALGTPVIATDAGGTRELCPDAECPTLMLVPAGDATAIASAIIELHQNETRQQPLVSSALNLIHTQHRVEVAVGRVEACIEDAVNA